MNSQPMNKPRMNRFLKVWRLARGPSAARRPGATMSA